MFKLVLEKAEEPEIKLPTSAGSQKKQQSSRKSSISALLIMPKPFTVSVQFSSVAKLCLSLCNPMNCSTPGLPVITNSQSPPKPMCIESVMPFNHLFLCHPLLHPPSIFPISGSFPMSQLFPSGGQIIEVLASASVFPMNIQDSFPLGLTGWISLQSKGLSRVFFNTAVQKH